MTLNVLEMFMSVGISVNGIHYTINANTIIISVSE